MANLFELCLADKAACDRLAVEAHDGARLTYAELVAETGRMANALVATGVRAGDRVAVQVEKSLANLVLYLACLRAGAVFLPLNTAYTLPEVGYFVGDAEPSLIVCDPSAREGVCGLPGAARVETLDGAGQGSLAQMTAAQGAAFATVARSEQDLAAIVYTSGTTGRSKGAMLSHGNLASNARTLVEAWRFTDRDVLIHALPIYHVHGLFVAINVLTLAGGSMLFLPKFDAAEVLERMPRATAVMGVPTFYTRLLARPELTRELAAGMRLFVSGSAPLLADTHHQWRARTGHAILERYGMTETGMNVSNPYDGERIAGTVGLPLPGVEVRIADPDTGATLPAGGIGMIEVRGPNVFKGYWRMPEKTRAEFRPDGFFITGDLGQVDERGYVSIVGRGKDMIITGGLNVYPIEVEERIDQLPGVAESAVVGLPHPDFGEAVTAVVAIGGGPAPSEAEVLAALEHGLASFKRPKRVIFVEELPRNTMGKVQKAALRQEYAQLYQVQAPAT
jgi:malonyl-CoA/methylmalonyl-CoA synthetase